MKVLTPGHHYDLTQYDRTRPEVECLRFVQRVGPGYPGNRVAHPGTNCQEVLRGLIHRIQYLNNQDADARNTEAIAHARAIIRLFEERAAERHGRPCPAMEGAVELLPTCAVCGHIGCTGESCRHEGPAVSST